MGLLETLSSLIPDFSLGDVIIGGEKNVEERKTIIVDYGDGDAVERTEDANIVDVGEFDSENRERAQEALVQEWESVEELFRESTAQDKQALEASFGDEKIADTLDYFRPLIPKHYFGTLEAALHMRKQMEMMDSPPRDWVRARRKDIAERYDGHTYQVVNLCSAGYFDEGRYLRELYEEMRQDEEYREGDYADVFEQIVAHRPFTIFVSSGDQVSDVKQEIYSTVQNRERHDVNIEFIDVRGMGKRNREKIQEAVKRIAGEAGDFDVSVRNERPELVLRIDPDTISTPK